jgi:4-hydroxybenzoate polyprenyltransferase
MLLLGIVFSGNLFSAEAWTEILLAIVSFTAVASATYVYNDISDVEEDRNHPVKQNRPIASGQLSVSAAAVFGAGLFAGGFILALIINGLFAVITLAYILQNILYSLYLKQVVIADILLIAVGFVLRAVAGVVAIGVLLSPWLVVCTFLTALLLAIGKRRHEMKVHEEPGEARATLEDYDADSLDQFLVITMSTLLVSYSLYTFFGTSAEMMITLPFAFFATFRYQHLVLKSDISAEPARLATDYPFLANLCLWTVAVIVVLYGGFDVALAFTGES